jgi:hypothetical protein
MKNTAQREDLSRRGVEITMVVELGLGNPSVVYFLNASKVRGVSDDC